MNQWKFRNLYINKLVFWFVTKCDIILIQIHPSDLITLESTKDILDYVG